MLWFIRIGKFLLELQQKILYSLQLQPVKNHLKHNSQFSCWCIS